VVSRKKPGLTAHNRIVEGISNPDYMVDGHLRHAFERHSASAPNQCLRCPHPKNKRVHTYVRCGQWLEPERLCSCVTANAPPGPRTSDQLARVPVSQWTDREVCKYVAFIFDSAAHLSGGFGALTPLQCQAIARRLNRIDSKENQT